MIDLMTTLPTNHINQFNNACQSLNLREDTIQRIENCICGEDSEISEEILESFFENSRIASQPLSVDWNAIVAHIWLDLDEDGI